MNMRFILPVIFYFLITMLTGCAAIKEAGKGFVGVSTQVLEDKRKDALKKSFALGYNDCYLKVKDILMQKNAKDTLDQASGESIIYAEDLNKKMIAIYLSSTDTTPVGIFFTENPGPNTLIEISSPSIYAKEEMSNRIFSAIDALIKPKVILGEKADVKEEVVNK